MLTLDIAHVDKALTQVSVAYINPAFVAENILPVVPVNNKRDIYFKFSKQHFLAEDDSYRPGSHAKRIEIDLEPRGFYNCDGHALEVAIPDELRENADPGAQIEIEYTQKLTQKILLKEEVLFAGLLTAANITNNTTLSGTSQWSDYINSDPVPVVDSAKETIQQAVGVIPNQLLMSRPVFRTLRNHPRIIDRVKYTGTGVRRALTAEDIADVLGIDKVIIPQALQSGATLGRADSLSYIYGKSALLFYNPDKPSVRTPAFGYTFLWTGSGAGYMVKRYREEGEDSEIVKVKKFYDQRLTEPKAAYLWLAAIA